MARKPILLTRLFCHGKKVEFFTEVCAPGLTVLMRYILTSELAD